MNTVQSTTYPSPFYRVATRAVIFNEKKELLVFKNKHGIWELPGGGLEHDETLEENLSREIREEIGAELESVGRILALWRSTNATHGFEQLRIGVEVRLKSDVFISTSEAVETRFVNKLDFFGPPT